MSHSCPVEDLSLLAGLASPSAHTPTLPVTSKAMDKTTKILCKPRLILDVQSIQISLLRTWSAVKNAPRVSRLVSLQYPLNISQSSSAGSNSIEQIRGHALDKDNFSFTGY
jgi:hypothetical protein